MKELVLPRKKLARVCSPNSHASGRKLIHHIYTHTLEIAVKQEIKAES